MGDQEDNMIRELQKADIERVAEIWLDTNIKAHNFIPSQYWLDHYAAVKNQLAQAEVYVYESEETIQGFIGMIHDYIAGVFVWYQAQSNGIGKELLKFVKGNREKLTLNVYQKNSRAVRFYQREGFKIQSEGRDEDTKEKDYVLIWTRRQN